MTTQTLTTRIEALNPSAAVIEAAAAQVAEALEEVEYLMDFAEDAPTKTITTREAAQDVAYVTQVAAQAEAAVEACGEMDDEDLKPFAEAYDRLYDAQDRIREIVSETEDILAEQEEEDARVTAAWAALEAVREAYAAAHAESGISPEEWAEDVWPAYDIRDIESTDWADAIYPGGDRSAADFQIYLPTYWEKDFWAIARRAEHNLAAMGFGEKGFDPTNLIEEIG